MTSWPDAVTFAMTWERSVGRAPQSTFLVFEAPDGRATEWSYAEFDLVVSRAAALLRSYGVEPGS